MKKGFTLIELLAVIVILAIIALIATPIILGIINDAREDSNKRSIENYAHAVELSVARYASGANGVIPVGTYKTDSEEKTRLNKIDVPETSPSFLTVDYKGEKIEATVEITTTGEVKITNASLDNGKTSYNYSETKGVTKNEISEGEDKEESSPFKVTKDGVLLHYERQGNETSVVVPSEVNGIKIKKIAANAFMPGNCIIFMSEGYAVKLDNEYTEEEAAFAQQNNLRVVTMEELQNGDVSVIIKDEPSSSHIYYKGTIDLTQPEKIKYVFDYDKSSYYLENIDLSNMKYLESISSNAFVGYDKDDCFHDELCGAGPLKSVKFPLDGVLTIIGEGAFKDNNLEEITIPSTVEIIGYNAFNDNKIRALNILNGVTTLETTSFSSNLLETVTLPSSVINIGDYVFSNNSNLKTITIKRENSNGINLGYQWNGSAQVEYNPN